MAAAALAGIVVVAFNLRLGVVGVGPVLEEIRRDTGMSSALAGVLTTIPFICMGAFSLAGSRFVERLGREQAITAGLVLIVVGTLLRAAVSTPALLIAATIPIGLGIAIANVALAAVVKDRFPDRPGAATGAYVAALSIGSAAITGGIVPLAHALGGWQEAFAVSAVPTVVALGIWTFTRAGGRAGAPAAELPAAGPRQMRAAILLGLTFGFQSICYAAIVSWGPAVFTDAGWSESRAALVTSLLPVVTIAAGLLMPALSDGRDRRRWVVFGAVLQTIGMMGVAFAPAASPFVWIVVFGIGNGGVFALSLTLPQDIGRTPNEVAWLTSWTLGLGFLMSSTSPILVGALRDLTGGFALPMALIGAVGASAAVTAMALGRPHLAASQLSPTPTSTPSGGSSS